MTNEEIINQLIREHQNEDIYNQIEENMYNYIDQSDIDDFDGDMYAAYSELGRGEAESQLIQELLSPFDLSVDDYCEVSDALCEEWSISTD